MSTLSWLNWKLLIITVSRCSSSRVVGRPGQDVTLTCKYDVKKYGALRVCWGRGDLPNRGCSDQLIYTDGHKVAERRSSRYQLLGRLDQGDASLTIVKITEDDAGRYGCRLMMPGPFNDLKYHLDLRVDTATSDVSTSTGSDVSTSTGSDVSMSTGSDVTFTSSTATVSMTTPGPELTTFINLIGNSVKVSLIIILIFITALVVAVNVWRRRHDGRTDQSEEA